MSSIEFHKSLSIVRSSSQSGYQYCSEDLNLLTLSYQKRNADAPLVRFLPPERLPARGQNPTVSRATVVLSAFDFSTLQHAASKSGVGIQSLILAGIATLLAAPAAYLAFQSTDRAVELAALAVAESDARRMKAWVGYLTLTAPYDGVIVARRTLQKMRERSRCARIHALDQGGGRRRHVHA